MSCEYTGMDIALDDSQGLPEPKTMEEEVVDDWITLEGNGERLLLDYGSSTLILADTETSSKQQIRAFEEKLRESLETMTYDATARLRSEIDRERRANLRTDMTKGNDTDKEVMAVLAARSTRAEAEVKRLEEVISVATKRLEEVISWSKNNYVYFNC